MRHQTFSEPVLKKLRSMAIEILNFHLERVLKTSLVRETVSPNHDKSLNLATLPKKLAKIQTQAKNTALNLV